MRILRRPARRAGRGHRGRAGGPGRGPLPGRRGLIAGGRCGAGRGDASDVSRRRRRPRRGARRAEELGLDGVFVFDHLWPMGAPAAPRPVGVPRAGGAGRLHAHRLLRPARGPRRARARDVLVAELLSLDQMAPGRLIAGLGTGDRKSAAENLAFGIPVGGSRRAPLGPARVRAPHARSRRAGVGRRRGAGHHRARRGARCRRQPVGRPARRVGAVSGRAAR